MVFRLATPPASINAPSISLPMVTAICMTATRVNHYVIESNKSLRFCNSIWRKTLTP